MLKLPAQIQLGIRDKKILMGHARSLVNIENAETQMSIYFQIVKNGLSVRKVEELVKQALETKQGEKQTVTSTALPPEFAQLRDKLIFNFETTVQVKRNKDGKGSIVIPFSSDEDLEKISNVFNKI